MAKQRIVNTKFWDDSYILNLKPIEKLVFLYLLTNPLTNISGVYELPMERVAFDTGISREKIEATFRKFEEDGKIVRLKGWVGIVNFIKHQTLNPKVKQGIVAELKRAPKELTDRLSIDYQKLGIVDDSQSHLNPNLNNNSNPNGIFLGELSTEDKETLRRRRQELLKKWQL